MDQQQEQKKSGSILNNLQGASSNLRVGRFLVAQGAKLAASALSGLGLPLLITILVIFIFTFLIVGFAPGGSGETGPTPQPSQPPISITPPPDGPTPTPGGETGRTCTRKYEGIGYCSVENLLGSFGNNETKALIASLICQAESGSNPYALNPVCPDYSVGLFQINLIAHCSGAYDPSDYSACILIDKDRRSVCQAQFENASHNVQYAVQISHNGNVWTPTWSTWLYPSGNIPAVRNTLTTCGINY